jgi:oligopeptide/dipeptide ABC transporter ATP-binding protein
MMESFPFLSIDDLHVHFHVGHRHRRLPLRAVDGVGIDVERGSVTGIVGESGCGKTTLARAIVGLVAPTSGAVRFEGEALPAVRTPSQRRRIQLVFQDPGSSLNPRKSVGSTLAELIRFHHLRPDEQVRNRCVELLDLVGLPARHLDSLPKAMSGGQRQRVVIARALAVEPDLLIADEAVAAVDVSVQAAILNLFADLRERLGLTMLFISHDLGVVRSICDRVAVMYIGRIVEEAPTEPLFEDPQHPYTRALLAAAPRLGVPLGTGPPALQGDPASPLDESVGCRFFPRCPDGEHLCQSVDPADVHRPGRRAACHFAWKQD